MSYKESIEKLLEGIKEDYAGWGSNPNDLEDSQKQIRLRMIDEFNNHNQDLIGIFSAKLGHADLDI